MGGCGEGRGGQCAMSIDAERAAIRKQWPTEFDDGARCGFSWQFKGPREPGGYPKGFHSWPLARQRMVRWL